MDYKINDICNNLSIGKSTIYKRLEVLKKDISPDNLRNNEFFYYTEKNKLFITEQGFNFIKNFNKENYKENVSKKETENNIIVYQNQIIEMYKERISYLETENKKLIDLLAIKEQKEIAQGFNYLNDANINSKHSFFNKIFGVFKNK